MMQWCDVAQHWLALRIHLSFVRQVYDDVQPQREVLVGLPVVLQQIAKDDVQQRTDSNAVVAARSIFNGTDEEDKRHYRDLDLVE
ncbi:hypothetical protein AAVH_40387, partial [Aphelenchoides avenae]